MEQVKERKKKVKVEKSEADIVQQYAKGIMHRQVTRGQADRVIKTGTTTNKDLWLDTDFFFSVCFQSTKQKNAFMDQFVKKFGIAVDENDKLQIINGVKLAEKMGIKIELEKASDYPTGSLDLRPFVLDNTEL